MSVSSDKYIKYDVNTAAMLDYSQVSLKTNDNKNLRDLMEHYLDKGDLYTSVVAGGIFSQYQEDSMFAQHFPSLFTMYKNKQDVDIFIQDPSNGQVENMIENKFKHYISKIESKGIKITQICTNKGRDYSSLYALDMNKYKVNCFKFYHTDGQIINLIFPSKCDFSQVTDFFETFDFTLTKIFYCYQSDFIYLPIELMRPYNSMCLNLSLENARVDVLTNLNSIEFIAIMNLICDLLETTCRHSRNKQFRSINTRNRYFIHNTFMNLSVLKGYFSVNYRRIMKYAFKNYFLNTNDAIMALRKIKLIHVIFGTLIDENKTMDDTIMTNCLFGFFENYKNELININTSEEIAQFLSRLSESL
jgi:hypothetical protein